MSVAVNPMKPQTLDALLTGESLKQLLNLLPGNLFITDQEHRTLYSNRAQDSFIEESLIGKDFLYLARKLNPNHLDLVEQCAQAIFENDRYVLETEKTCTFEETMPVDGKKIHFISHKAPLYDGQKKLIGIIGYAIDMTPQKQSMMKLEAANKKLTTLMQTQLRFLANISHDIKTPLSGAHGMLQVIIANTDDPAIKENAFCALNALTQLFHYFSKIIEAEYILNHQQDNGTHEASPVHLPQLINQCLDLHRPLAKLKKLTLTSSIPQDFPRSILLPHESLWAVLTNLTANALKFTEHGGIEVKVVQTIRYKKPYFKLMIQDSGVGIAKQHLQTIFDPFFRIKSDCTHSNRGSGLGLSIVKKHIKKMGGQIHVESKKGVGTTFICHIPLYISDEQALPIDHPDERHTEEPLTIKHPLTTIAHQTKQQNSITLVLVEDDPVILTASCHLMAKAFSNLHLLTFNTAQKALDHFSDPNQLSDGFILDVGLPDMRGDRLAEKLAQLPQIKRNTPILALTGHGITVSSEAFDAVYEKPLTIDNIDLILQKHLTHNQYIRLKNPK